MKTFLIALFILCHFVSISRAVELPIFNAQEFNGFRWGSNLKNEYPQLECTPNRMAAATYCVLKNESLTFLGVDLLEKTYSMSPGQYQTRFDLVNMSVKSRLEWDQLKNKLIKEFGNEYVGNLAGGSEVYIWQKEDLEIELKDVDLPGRRFYSLSIKNKKFYFPRASQTVACEKTMCNVNNDDHCDQQDLEILDKSLGQCNQPGHYHYNSDADKDLDECITKKDRVIVEEGLGTSGYVCEKFDR